MKAAAEAPGLGGGPDGSSPHRRRRDHPDRLAWATAARTFYERVHAPTLGTTLGTACIVVASMIYFSAAGDPAGAARAADRRFRHGDNTGHPDDSRPCCTVARPFRT